MIADAGLAWPFGAWFAIIAIVSLVGAARARRWPDRASYLAHVVMAATMAAMPWPWFVAVPWLVWIALFGLAALGYLALAISRPGVAVGPGAGHHARRLVAWYHAGMMLGMVWMTALMELLILAMPVGDGPIGDGNGVVIGGGHGMPDSFAPGAAPPLWHLPLWTIAVTFAFAAMFVLAAAWFLRQLRSAAPGPGTGPLPARVELILSSAMAVGMAVAYFVMS